MKKTMLILSAIALVLILLVGGGIWYLISSLTGAEQPQTRSEVAVYLAEHWPMYRLRSWNPDTGVMELENPQQLTYERIEKYGAVLDLTADQPGQMKSLRIALREACGVTPARITVYGVSSDGREVYAMEENGSFTACWLTEPAAPESEP